MDILRWSLRWLSAAAAVFVPRPGNVAATAATAQSLTAGAGAHGSAVGVAGAAQGIVIVIGPAGAAGANVTAAGGIAAVLELGDLP